MGFPLGGNRPAVEPLASARETPASQPRGGGGHEPSAPSCPGGRCPRPPASAQLRTATGERSPPLPSHAGNHRPGDKRKRRPQLPSWTWDLGAEASGARTAPRVGTGGAQPCPGPTRKVSSAPWRDVTGRGVSHLRAPSAGSPGRLGAPAAACIRRGAGQVVPRGGVGCRRGRGGRTAQGCPVGAGPKCGGRAEVWRPRRVPTLRGDGEDRQGHRMRRTPSPHRACAPAPHPPAAAQARRRGRGRLPRVAGTGFLC